MPNQEIEALPEAFLEAIGEAVVVVGPTGAIVYVNGRAEELLGRTASELLGTDVELLIPETLREHHRQLREEFSAHPAPGSMGSGRELAVLRPDGTELPAEIALGPLTIAGKQHALCVLRDLSEPREGERRLQEIADAMPGLFYLFDGEGRLQWWNRLFEETFGYSPSELDGKHILEFLHPEDQAVVAERMALLFADGQPRSAEYRIVRKNGELIPYYGTGALCEIGGEVQMVGLAIDQSELVRTQRELEERVREVEELRRQLELENTYLRAERAALRPGNIVGESPAIRKVLTELERVARTPSTVLLLGETGTGKELLAQRIHELSPRSGRTLVKVNCASLPPTLMEAELFGREKGAYTGAVSREPGRFEIADESTLFLDEVGELPLELQAKLLRVLQEGQFERVGSSRTLTADVRIIAATNRDLADAVRQGSFRRDLYYRLNVFPVRVPPLRERREDIPLLVWAFVERIGNDMGLTVDTISQRTMERLQNHPWPGNVRELRNVIERSMILSHGRTLTLSLPYTEESVDGEALTLDEVQRRHIRKVLDLVGGKISGPGGAAEILGLKPTTLRSRMEKLGVTPRG